MTERLRVDWGFVALTAVIFGVPWLVHAVGVDARNLGWQLAALATFGLVIRLIGWFHDTPTGMRMMAVLLVVSLILGAAGQYIASNNGSPQSWVTYALISQRLACIGAAIYWPRGTDTRISPFVRLRA